MSDADLVAVAAVAAVALVALVAAAKGKCRPHGREISRADALKMNRPKLSCPVLFISLP